MLASIGMSNVIQDKNVTVIKTPRPTIITIHDTVAKRFDRFLHAGCEAPNSTNEGNLALCGRSRRYTLQNGSTFATHLFGPASLAQQQVQYLFSYGCSQISSESRTIFPGVCQTIGFQFFWFRFQQNWYRLKRQPREKGESV